MIDGLLDSIDAISQEAARILERPVLDENGVVENGGRSSTTLAPGVYAPDLDTNNLQVSE